MRLPLVAHVHFTEQSITALSNNSQNSSQSQFVSSGGGGLAVAEGTPEQAAAVVASYTGRCPQAVLHPQPVVVKGKAGREGRRGSGLVQMNWRTPAFVWIDVE
jgi:hypothetical protein